MLVLLAAVGAVAAALLETSLVPYLAVGGAHPHPVLALGVVWTVAAGVESGLVWAFAGGLALDALAQRPIGSSSFALLLCMAGAGILAGISHGLFPRARPLAPIPLVFLLSLLNSILLLVIHGALLAPIPVPDPLGALMPGALYDTVVATLVGPLAVVARDRQATEARSDW